MGSSYDLGCAIEAIANTQIKSLRFIVMGDGPLMEEFVRYAEQYQIRAIFTGRIPYDKMVALLCKCDIAINPIIHGAAQSIINKHADYVACGLPIISTQESSEFRTLVDVYQMGINCSNDNVSEISDAIIKLVDDPELRRKLGDNARKCAEERFDRKITYSNIVDTI